MENESGRLAHFHQPGAVKWTWTESKNNRDKDKKICSRGFLGHPVENTGGPKRTQATEIEQIWRPGPALDSRVPGPGADWLSLGADSPAFTPRTASWDGVGFAGLAIGDGLSKKRSPVGLSVHEE
jgi:hypothetical protein